ncbi:MAG: hypothetical protein KIH01_03505 [Candidatus Freyarchaeota archaeon]|nr:hypothetical protein [Candidatus Jordarchaeia archaeon]
MRGPHLVISCFAILGLILSGIAISPANATSNSTLAAILVSATKPSTTPPSDTLTVTFVSEGTNQLSPEGCLPGDIILLGTPGSFFDYLIPGRFQHTVIYCGQVKPGEQIWDRTNKRWMPVGTHYVIHSTKSSEQGNGLGYDTWEVAVNAHAGEAVVLRVFKPGGVPLTASERQAIVNFLKSQLAGGPDGYPVGPAYDWGWTSKQVLASEPNPVSGVSGYYCSEAAWAAYKYVLGIDLDSETSPFGLGVSPDDLLHSQYTSVIAGDVDGSRWSAASGLYKLTVYLKEIYYYDDYDPWPWGAGEEYVKAFIGDGFFPTEEGYPGSGKIGLCPEGWWSRDGPGLLSWNKYFYSIINYGRDAKIRIEAWEHDDIGGDDQYPPFQLYWSPSQWHQYIGKGWNVVNANFSDCRYTVYFRIDPISW